MLDQCAPLFAQEPHRLRSGAARLHDRLGDVLRPLERTADIDAGYGRLHRREGVRRAESQFVELDTKGAKGPGEQQGVGVQPIDAQQLRANRQNSRFHAVDLRGNQGV